MAISGLLGFVVTSELLREASNKMRTPTERYCTILATAAILLCGVLTVTLFMLYFRNVTQDEGSCDICLTKGCVTAAHNILAKMDFDVDPCENFYEFACGNFLKEVTIPDDQKSVTQYINLRNSVTNQLRSILEEPKNQLEARSYMLAKTFFKACMDTARIEQIGLTRIKHLVSHMGGWPVLEGDAWNEAQFLWKDLIFKFRQEGFSIDYMFKIYVDYDPKNSSQRIVIIDQVDSSLAHGYLIKGMDEKLVVSLYSYVVDIAVLFGADRKRAEKELKESLQFEIELAKISLSPEKRRDFNKLDNRMSIRELQERYSSIPWMEYLEKILPKEVGKIYYGEIVNVAVPDFMRKLENLLIKTPKRVQANYLMGRAVRSIAPLLNKAVQDRHLEYSAALNGQTQEPPRWEKCAKSTGGRLPLATGSMYVRKFFTEAAKISALKIVKNVQEQMCNLFETVDWMDEKTRKNAREKACTMKSYVGYPDEMLDENKLDQHYEKLHLHFNDQRNDTDYLDVVLRIHKFDEDLLLGKLHQPVDKNDWSMQKTAVTVNAYYDTTHNAIDIPAGILQGEFFSHDQPNYINYGSIGEVIGHEVTHGFDDQGRQFDKEGNLVDWWEPETKEAYLKKAACIIQQYGNYTMEQVGLKLDGVNTQGENIADNGGIKLAYLAYNSWVRRHGVEKRLPGLKRFTPRQMFWISAATKECAKYRDEEAKYRIVADPHAPAEFRILGTFSNRQEFADDFHCPRGSPMNPTNKCQVW